MSSVFLWSLPNLLSVRKQYFALVFGTWSSVLPHQWGTSWHSFGYYQTALTLQLPAVSRFKTSMLPLCMLQPYTKSVVSYNLIDCYEYLIGLKTKPLHLSLICWDMSWSTRRWINGGKILLFIKMHYAAVPCHVDVLCTLGKWSACPGLSQFSQFYHGKSHRNSTVPGKLGSWLP